MQPDAGPVIRQRLAGAAPAQRRVLNRPSAAKVRIAEFARILGTSAATVSQWIVRGLVNPDEETGRIEVAPALRRLRELGFIPADDRLAAELIGDIPAPLAAAQAAGIPTATIPLSALPPPPPPPMGYDAAQALDKQLQAAMRAHELRARRGETVDRRQAEAIMFGAARELRDAILAWPARHAAVMAAELGTDPGRLLRALEAGVKAMLRDLPAPRFDMPQPEGADADDD